MSRTLQFAILTLALAFASIAGLPGAVSADSGDANALDSQSAYPTIAPGQSAFIWMAMKNTGATTWRANGVSGYGYVGTDGYAGQRGNLCCDIRPGETIKFSGTVTPPARPGTYRYGDMLTHNGVPFGQYFFIDVTVSSSSSSSNGSGNGSRTHLNYNPFAAQYSDQCTYYAEQQMYGVTGLFMPEYHNARYWISDLAGTGWSTGSTPQANSVMVMQPHGYWWWDGTKWVYWSHISDAGHVAWVTEVYGSMVYVNDQNWNLDGRVGGRWIWIGFGEPVAFIYS